MFLVLSLLIPPAKDDYAEKKASLSVRDPPATDDTGATAQQQPTPRISNNVERPKARLAIDPSQNVLTGQLTWLPVNRSIDRSLTCGHYHW